MGFINPLDIRIAMFQVSHRSGDRGTHCRMVLAFSSKPVLEPYDYAWSAIDCLYGLNDPGPPSPLGEVYDPNPNRRARFQSIYLGEVHLVFALWYPAVRARSQMHRCSRRFCKMTTQPFYYLLYGIRFRFQSRLQVHPGLELILSLFSSIETS